MCNNPAILTIDLYGKGKKTFKKINDKFENQVENLIVFLKQHHMKIIKIITMFQYIQNIVIV